jgi:molybdopterin molybdotransferase
MMSPQEALQAILSHIPVLPPVSIPLEDCLGRVLAEDVFSDENVPPFTNSAMDGFALQAKDLAEASSQHPVSLRILADLPAGTTFGGQVHPGETVRIMTGAPLPAGADSVVRVEDTSQVGEYVICKSSIHYGSNIRLEGEDIVRGSLALHRGKVLRPAQIGILAIIGHSHALVHPSAKVAILTTGDELVDHSSHPGPGQIRDANGPALSAQVREIGAIALPYPRVADQRETLRLAITQALAKADLILTSGGVSVGDFDYVKEVLGELGAERLFWGVSQKPGKPLGFWMVRSKPVIGLPGNPVSSMLCLEEYVRPALRKMMGFYHLFRPERIGILTVDYPKEPDGRQHLLRVQIEVRENRLYATPTGPQGSGVLTSMARAQALAIIPAEASSLAKGSEVSLHMTEWPEDLSC